MKKRVFRNVLGLALAAVMTVSAAMPALAARGRIRPMRLWRRAM